MDSEVLYHHTSDDSNDMKSLYTVTALMLSEPEQQTAWPTHVYKCEASAQGWQEDAIAHTKLVQGCLQMRQHAEVAVITTRQGSSNFSPFL